MKKTPGELPLPKQTGTVHVDRMPDGSKVTVPPEMFSRPVSKKGAGPDFSVDLTGPHEEVTERLERLLPSKPPAPGHILDASGMITQEDEKELEEAHRAMDAVWERPIPPEEAFELACDDSRAFIRYAEEAGYSDEEIASFIESEARKIVARIPGLDMASVIAKIKETGRELSDDEDTDDALTRLHIKRP